MKTKVRANKLKWLQILFDKAIYELEILSEERSISDSDYDQINYMMEKLESMKRKYQNI